MSDEFVSPGLQVVAKRRLVGERRRRSEPQHLDDFLPARVVQSSRSKIPDRLQILRGPRITQVDGSKSILSSSTCHVET